MNRTFSLPFHSLSLLLLGITAGLVYTNYSVVQNQGKVVHAALLTQTQQHINNHTDVGMWVSQDKSIRQGLLSHTGFSVNGSFCEATPQHNEYLFYKDEQK